jgi:hypothetical protein
MPFAMYLAGATLSVATPNTSYIHAAAQRPAHATTIASREQPAPERRALSMNGRGQYWHVVSTTDQGPAAPTTTRSFLSVGK